MRESIRKLRDRNNLFRQLGTHLHIYDKDIMTKEEMAKIKQNRIQWEIEVAKVADKHRSTLLTNAGHILLAISRGEE